MKKHISTPLLIVFFITIFFQQHLFCQALSEQQLDSLKQQASICDSIGVTAMFALQRYAYGQSNHSLHLYYVNREIDCAEKGGDKYKRIKAYVNALYYYNRLPHVDSLMIYANKIFDLTESDTSKAAKTARIQTLGFAGSQYYYKTDDIETAYDYFQQSMNEAYAHKFYGLYLVAVYDIANYYLIDQEYEKTIEFVNESLAKVPDPNQVENKPYFVKVHMPSFDRAKKDLNYIKAKAVLYDKTHSDSDKMNAYGLVLDFMKDYQDRPAFLVDPLILILGTMGNLLPIDTLLAYGEKAVQLDQMFDESDHYTYRRHGSNLIKAGKYKEAKKFLEKALVIAKQQPDWFDELAVNYDALATVNLNLGETKDAQVNFDLTKIYLDSANIRKNKSDVEIVETKYALSQKEAENLRITQEAENLSDRLKLFTLLGILLFLLLALVITFYLNQRKNAERQRRLNETKDKIFAILGHDLKGPSLAFNSLTKKLSYLIKKNDTERLLELAPSFEESGGRVSKIINDVLNWALTENESFLNSPEKLAVLPLIKEAVHDLDLNLKEKNISINVTVDETVDVLFDKNAFRIINRNLIHNAIKFSPLNATINIRYNNQEKNLEYVDQGKGMDREVIKKILNETPVESSLGTQNERGIGIGLVTCLKLAKLNNGKLSFFSNNPSGTIIKFGLN